MAQNKSAPPRITIAPEFSGPGSLARALKPQSAPAAALHPFAAAENGDSWAVLGVGAIWQTAAENAARLSGCELAQWLRDTIEEAAQNQGFRKK